MTNDTDHVCDTGNFDRSLCPEPCGSMHSYCSTCGERQDRCAHETVTPGWPKPAEAKAILRSARIASGASDEEFQAAFVGMLSTMVGPAQWADAAARTIYVFRDRR